MLLVIIHSLVVKGCKFESLLTFYLCSKHGFSSRPCTIRVSFTDVESYSRQDLNRSMKTINTVAL